MRKELKELINILTEKEFSFTVKGSSEIKLLSSSGDILATVVDDEGRKEFMLDTSNYTIRYQYFEYSKLFERVVNYISYREEE